MACPDAQGGRAKRATAAAIALEGVVLDAGDSRAPGSSRGELPLGLMGPRQQQGEASPQGMQFCAPQAGLTRV